jgi:hypothetical protein
MKRPIRSKYTLGIGKSCVFDAETLRKATIPFPDFKAVEYRTAWDYSSKGDCWVRFAIDAAGRVLVVDSGFSAHP